MKNKQLIVTILIASTLLFGLMSIPARASITSWKWLGYAFKGVDTFYDPSGLASIVAYQEKSTATLSVTVYNDYVRDKPVNISALKVGFDWGKNYTSSMTSMNTPYVIPWHESRVLPIIFTVPNLTQVSNLAVYSYTIYLEYVNSTTGQKGIIGFEKDFGASNFVVYSADQVDAQKTMQIVEELFDITEPSDFNSTQARLLWIQAWNETFVADLLYNQGDFSGANTHYSTALSLTNKAFAAENTKGGGFDAAQVQLLQAQAKSFEASANYFNGLSNMWVLIGVAAVLFSIGYIIRGFGALRKPTAAT